MEVVTQLHYVLPLNLCYGIQNFWSLRVEVALVPYKPEYLDEFLRWRDQAASIRHNPLMKVTREETAEMLLKDGCDLADLKVCEKFRWFIQADGEVVGNISLKNISHSMGYAEIGYGVSEDYHGRGIATEAVRLLARKVFSETPLRKLFAYVHDLNLPSCRVLEKAGFQKEGVLREHYVINGRPENEIFYGLLKSEFTGKLAP